MENLLTLEAVFAIIAWMLATIAWLSNYSGIKYHAYCTGDSILMDWVFKFVTLFMMINVIGGVLAGLFFFIFYTMAR